MRTLSLRARLTVWYIGVLVVVLCIGGADLLWVLGRLSERRVDRELDGLSDTVANVVRGELAENGTAEEAAREACDTVALRGRAVAVLRAGGEVLDARWSGLDASRVSRLLGPERVSANLDSAEGGWRVHVNRAVFGDNSFVIVVASPLMDVMRERAQVREAMMYGIPLVLLFAAGGGFWLAAIGLRPLTAMAEQAARILPSGTERLGDPERQDEIGELTRAFNALLDRLRSSLRFQRQFMADASHELRTPVSVIRTAAEVSLNRMTRPESQYRETISIVRDESARLSRLVADMLTLAKADAGGYPLRPVDLYLEDVLADCARTAAVLAGDRSVVIERAVSPDLPVRGDEDLLHELIRNVLQNAVQHTRPGGRVSITGRVEAAGVRVDISDEGPGIAPEDQSRIFERFVQIDSARHGQGSGLGLPIARWIAEAHGGRIELTRSGPDGSTFSIWLPASSVPEPRAHVIAS